jgi:hypothetical protein
MPTKKRASAPTKKRRAHMLTVTLTPDEREAAEALAAEHGTSVSRVVGAAVLALRVAKAAPGHIERANARAPIGRPRNEE